MKFRFASMIAIRVFGVLLRFVTTVFISREIGAEQFGVYSYVNQLVAMLALISFFGADQYILKVIPSSIRAKKIEQLNESTTSVAIITLVLSCISVLSLFVVSQRTTLIPNTYVLETSIGSLLIFPMLFLLFLNSILRANHYSVSSQIFDNIINPIFMLVTLFILVDWARDKNIRLTAEMLVYAALINYWIVAAIGLIFMQRKVRITPVFNHIKIIIIFKELIPLCFFVVLYQIFSRLPILTVGSTLGASELAQYFAASRVAEFIEFPLAIVSIFYISRYSELSIAEYEKKQQFLKDSSIILLLSSFVIYAIIYGLSGPIFRLFGEGMTESHQVFIVLGFGYALASATGIVDFALIRAGYSTMVNLSLLISIAVMLSLLICLPNLTATNISFIYAFCWMLNKFMMVYWLWDKNRLLALPLFSFNLFTRMKK